MFKKMAAVLPIDTKTIYASSLRALLGCADQISSVKPVIKKAFVRIW